jgi:hypothetical protein
MDENDPIKEVMDALRVRRETYIRDVLESRPFQDALRYLQGIASDFIKAQSYVRFQGVRFSASDDYLLFRFAPNLAESALSITMNAKEGAQNPARRELRFMLEAAVKLSVRDTHLDAKSFDDRLAGLNDRSKRFEDYVAVLQYFDEFENPQDANAEILSLYSDLSTFVHASVPQFERTLARDKRDETVGMETVATLNQFNKLAFRVYDIVLVRLFHGLGLSMAGDIFTTTLDDDPKWSFHRGKFVSRLSKCFDYKHERKSKPRIQ